MLFQMGASALFEEAVGLSHFKYVCLCCYWVFLDQSLFPWLCVSGILFLSDLIKMFSCLTLSASPPPSLGVILSFVESWDHQLEMM